VDINKHKKIAYILHTINLLFLLLGGFVIYIVSQAFIACADTSQNVEFTCSTALLVCFGLPVAIGVIPFACLKINNKFTKVVLYVYSGIIALAFIPIGTAIGWHTIYYLNNIDSKA